MSSNFSDIKKLIPEIYIFSKVSELSRSLFTIINEKECDVNVVSDFKSVKSLCKRLIERRESKNIYFLIIPDFINYSSSELRNYFSMIADCSSGLGTKNLIVFPYNFSERYSRKHETIINSLNNNINVYTALVYLGDIIFPNRSMGETTFLDGLLNDLFTGIKVKLPSTDSVFYPLSVDDAAENIVSMLFSMSAYRARSAILGPAIDSEYLRKIISGTVADSKIIYTGEKILNPEKVDNIRRLNTDISKLISVKKHNLKLLSSEGKHPKFKLNFVLPENLKEVFSKLSAIKNNLVSKFFGIIDRDRLNNSLKEDLSITKGDMAIRIKVEETDSIPSVINTRAHPEEHGNVLTKLSILNFTTGKKRLKLIYGLSLLVIVTFFIPYLTLSGGRMSLIISANFIEKGNFKASAVALKFSDSFFTISENTSLIFLKIFKTNEIYTSIYKNSLLLKATTEIGKSTLDIIKNILIFAGKVGNENNDNPVAALDLVSLEINTLYTKLGFLETDLSDTDYSKKYLNHFLNTDSSLEITKKKLSSLKSLLEKKEIILGYEKPVNYLFLIQDSSEIKPSGGDLESAWLLTLTDGMLSDYRKIDIGEIDKGIKSQVEPPLAMKKYFGVDSWKFADYNWLIDFPNAAQKSEWFLNKSMDLVVDGVIAVDTNVLHELTSLKLNRVEREENKDRDSLVNLIDGISLNNDKTNFINLKKIQKFLDDKQILIFLHDSKVRKALNDLDWDGSVTNISCSDSCYPDVIGIVETAGSLGSENIVKESDLEISFQEGVVKKKLTLYYENKNGFSYKSYLRLLARPDSGFAPVKISFANKLSEIIPEVYGINGYKEAGMQLELGQHEIKSVSFSWENEVPLSPVLNEYLLYYRKQPGEKDYPLIVSLKIDPKLTVNIKPQYSLTEEGVWVYNTDLTDNFVTSIFLKKQNE